MRSAGSRLYPARRAEGTVARHDAVITAAGQKKVVRTTEVVSVPSTIARADLADFLVDGCESPTWVGKAVQLGG